MSGDFDNPTLGEISRLQHQQYVQSETRFASLEAALKANSDISLQTLQQATKTNGRVNKIEDDFYGSDGYPGTRKEVHELRDSYLFRKGAQWVILGMITFIPGILIAFASLWVKEQVRIENQKTIEQIEHIEDKIDSNTSKIQDIQEVLGAYDIYIYK